MSKTVKILTHYWKVIIEKNMISKLYWIGKHINTVQYAVPYCLGRYYIERRNPTSTSDCCKVLVDASAWGPDRVDRTTQINCTPWLVVDLVIYFSQHESTRDGIGLIPPREWVVCNHIRYTAVRPTRPAHDAMTWWRDTFRSNLPLLDI